MTRKNGTIARLLLGAALLAAGPASADWGADIDPGNSPLLWHTEDQLYITCFADDATLMLYFVLPEQHAQALSAVVSARGDPRDDDGAIRVRGDDLGVRLVVHVGNWAKAFVSGLSYHYDPSKDRHGLTLLGTSFDRDDQILGVARALAEATESVGFELVMEAGMYLGTTAVPATGAREAATAFLDEAGFVGC